MNAKLLASVICLVSVSSSISAQPLNPSADTVGRVHLSQLREDVELRIDSYGVTHIKAANQEDLFFAQGYNAARDRLWQIDFWRRSGLGLLSEALGDEYLKNDRAARLLLYRGSIDAEWKSYGPKAKDITTSFVDGINAYIRTIEDGRNELPVEFVDLDYTPNYWNAEDIIRIRSHGVWQNVISEVERSFMLCRGSEKSDAIRIKLEPAHTLAIPKSYDPCSLPEAVLDTYLQALYPPNIDNRKGGSNNWAISGDKTATGRPIVASDPHRAFTVPSQRYAVHLTAPDLNVIGAGEPHSPGVSTGHNGQVAFGFTIFPADQEDLLIYTRNPNNENEYRYKDRWSSINTITESVSVKHKPAKEVTLKYTHDGAIIYEDQKNIYALKSIASEPGSAPYLGKLNLIHTKNIEQYDAALQSWGSPGEYHVFADTNGDIAWRAAAKIPKRNNYDGLLPIIGDGRSEWIGFHQLESLPGGRNPPQGWIATANNIVAQEHYPYVEKQLAFEWISDWRAQRIREVLERNEKHTIEGSLALQNDYTSVFARELINSITTISLESEKAIEARNKLHN